MPPSGALRTIYALSTPKGKGGIAIVRVSGPDVALVYRKMLRNHSQPVHAKLRPCRLVHPSTRSVIDDAMCVYFKAPKSYTTEDMLELHLHAGHAVIARTLESLSTFHTCRPAEPGEFTRRAFEAGRIDLTQAEGIRDLIDAETEEQRILAIKAAQGQSFSQLNDLRERLVDCMAMLEAIIDFGESDGIDADRKLHDQAKHKIRGLQSAIDNLLRDGRRGEIIRAGIRLAIFGPPNAGKSSLLNYLARRQAAIVTPIPGTTRDVLEVALDIGGFSVIACDTAGLRPTEDEVEAIGIERAISTMQNANLSMCVISLPESSEGEGPSFTVPSDIRSLITEDTLLFINKFDLGQSSNRIALEVNIKESFVHKNIWLGSLLSGEGIPELISGIQRVLRERFQTLAGADSPLITRSRHRVHLQRAYQHVASAMEYDDAVLIAEALRLASQEIGKIIGQVGIEDVLDHLFRGFCIGK